MHAALGVYAAGGVIVPLNTRFKGAEAAYILDRSQAKLLFTVTDFLDTNYVELLRAAEPVASLEQIVVLRGAPADDTISWTDFIARAERHARGRGRGPHRRAHRRLALRHPLHVGHDRPTRRARCSRTARASQAYDAWSTVVGLRAGDRYLVVNPFFHSFGLKAGILASLIKGATIVPHAVFDVDTVMQRVAEENISMLPGPPTVYQSILDHPHVADFDLSSLRLAVTGAAPVSVELIRRMREELKFETVVTGYGLTEATGIATMCRHDDDPETISQTAGRAIPGTEVIVVDDDNNPVPTGEPGEVVVRGYNVMVGFVDDPEATAEAIDTDGWLHTGDVGVLDERGNLAHHRPQEGHVHHRRVQRVSRRDREHGERPSRRSARCRSWACPTNAWARSATRTSCCAPARPLDPDELIAWSRERMANYKVPRYVQVVDALPLNASGKVLKYELREKANTELA